MPTDDPNDNKPGMKPALRPSMAPRPVTNPGRPRAAVEVTSPGRPAVSGTGASLPLPGAAPSPLPKPGNAPLPMPGNAPLPMPGNAQLPMPGNAPPPTPMSAPLPTPMHVSGEGAVEHSTSGARRRAAAEIVGAKPTVAAAARPTATDDPIGDALCEEYLPDQALWAFGELAELRALAPRAVVNDRRGQRAFDGATVYVTLLSRAIPEPVAQAFILRVEARLLGIGVATVLPAPVMRLSAEERSALLKPPAPAEPEPPRPQRPPPVVEAPAPVPIVTPKEQQRGARRQRVVVRVAGALAVVSVVAFGVVGARAVSSVEVTRTAVINAPASAVWEVVSGLEHQARYFPWLKGAGASTIEGDVLRTTMDGQELVVRRWNVALGQHVEMRVTGALTLSSAIDLVEQEAGQEITWTVSGPRGSSGAFADIAGERGRALDEAIVKLESGAKALAAERASAAARTAEETAALVAAAKAAALPEVEDPGGEGGDEHVLGPDAGPEGADGVEVAPPKPAPVEIEVERSPKPGKKKKPKRRR